MLHQRPISSKPYPAFAGTSPSNLKLGPLSFDYFNSIGKKPKLKLNPYSWTKVANIIFVDEPVGTGFSYAKTWEGYSNISDTLSAVQTYEFLRKWLMDRPKFYNNPLYIAGDTYSGITLPIVIQEISDGNRDERLPPMNLKGYVIGNPVTDTQIDRNYRVLFAYLKALIPEELYQSMKRNCKGEYVNVDLTTRYVWMILKFTTSVLKTYTLNRYWNLSVLYHRQNQRGQSGLQKILLTRRI